MTVYQGLRRTHEPLGTLAGKDALAAFATRCGEAAVGFCYSPRAARWFRLGSDGVPTGPDGTGLDLGGVFEVRAFTSAMELRWLHESGGRGHTVLVSDTPGTGDGPAPREPYRRLLRGTVADSANGWLRLYDGRVGSIAVPVAEAAQRGSTVYLTAVEYQAEDTHGNVSIVDERLTGLTAGGPNVKASQA